MKRQIKSEAELVNALCKGVKVLFDDTVIMEAKTMLDFDDVLCFNAYNFTYAEPVEVVELWGSCDDHDQWSFEDVVKEPKHTHKQTQIIQNNKIIWTETIKIKN